MISLAFRGLELVHGQCGQVGPRPPCCAHHLLRSPQVAVLFSRVGQAWLCFLMRVHRRRGGPMEKQRAIGRRGMSVL